MQLTAEMQENLASQEKKNQKFYDNLELNMDDLDQIESRISELENYVGIDPNTQLDYLITNDIEKIDIKSNQLDDFIVVIEDKNFMMNDLFSKYDQLENFLKNGNRFASQCLSLNQKSGFVIESSENITEFAKKLKEL